MNTSAMPRSGPTPNQPPIAVRPCPAFAHERDEEELRRAARSGTRSAARPPAPPTARSRRRGPAARAARPSAASCARRPPHRAPQNIQMKKPAASSQIEDWMVKKMQTVQVMQLTIISVRSGFFPSPVREMTMPLTMKAVERTPRQQAPDLHRDQRQAIGVEQRHEDAAEEVVEGRKEDEREEPGHRRDHRDRPLDVDALGLRRRILRGSAFAASRRSARTSRCSEDERPSATSAKISVAEHAAPGDEKAGDHRGGEEADARHHADEPVGLVAPSPRGS